MYFGEYAEKSICIRICAFENIPKLDFYIFFKGTNDYFLKPIKRRRFRENFRSGISYKGSVSHLMSLSIWATNILCKFLLKFYSDVCVYNSSYICSYFTAALLTK